MTKQHRSTDQLVRIWDSLNEDQRLDFINSDDITAVEVMRLDQARDLAWSPVLED
jgi:hypothetical protein